MLSVRREFAQTFGDVPGDGLAWSSVVKDPRLMCRAMYAGPPLVDLSPRLRLIQVQRFTAFKSWIAWEHSLRF